MTKETSKQIPSQTKTFLECVSKQTNTLPLKPQRELKSIDFYAPYKYIMFSFN